MTIDLDAMAINKAKFMADGNKYFELYRKHIPGNISGNILLLSIGNLDCISKIMSMNPNAKYLIIDRKTIIKSLTIVCKDIYDIEAIENDDEDLYNIIQELNMKFDCIIMNPPYQKNLHLKILAEAIKHLKDDNSVCVNLSPVRWLQDPLAQYKKHCDYKRFEESISKHTETLEVITAKKANDLFNITNFTDIGIYVTRNYQIKKFNYKDFNELKFAKCKTIINKILSYVISNEIHTYNYHLTTNDDGYRVVLSLITGQRGEQDYKNFYICACRSEIFKDGVDINTNKKYADICGGIKRAKAGQAGKELKLGITINFKTENEAKNFIKYCKLNCMTFCGMITKNDMHPQFKFLPFLGDAINPRTGLKGYEGEWTDDDLYKFFNITPDEQKIIEETMAKYK